MSSHEDWPWRRVTGFLGIAFFVLFAVGIVIGTQPNPDDPISEIREAFSDDDVLLQTANWILTLAFVFAFLPFAAGLRSVFAVHDVDAGMWSRTAYGVAVALVAIGGAGSAFVGATALGIDPALDDSVLRLVVYLDAFVFAAVIPFGTALFLVATCIVVVRTGVLWKWLGWGGLVVAVISLIGTLWPLGGDPEGPLTNFSIGGFLLFAVWVLLAGINLLKTPSATTN